MKLSAHILLMVVSWLQKIFCQSLQSISHSGNFFLVTQKKEKIRFWGKSQFFKLQSAIKSVIFNLESWNFQNHLTRPISSFFVFYFKKFEQDLKFRKSRNLTFRSRSSGMVWQNFFLLPSKFTFGSDINLAPLINFVFHVF